MQGFRCMIGDRCVSMTFACSADYAQARAWLAPAIESAPLKCAPVAEVHVDPSGVNVLTGPPLTPRRELAPFHQLELLLLEWMGTLVPDSRILHAGCFRIGGRLVLLVAPSGGGKSTLSLSAVLRGAEYITDDMVSLTTTRLSGLARSIRFKELVGGSTGNEPWLNAMDVNSIHFETDGVRRIVPLYAGAHRSLASAQLEQPVVVVALERGPDEIAPLTDLERVVLLHEAAIVRWGEYDGSLGPGPSFRLSWQDPDRAFELLLGELLKL